MKARDCAKIMEKHLSDIRNEVRIELLKNPTNMSYGSTEKEIREMKRKHEFDFNRIPNMTHFNSSCDSSCSSSGGSGLSNDNCIDRISDDDGVIIKMSHKERDKNSNLNSNNIHVHSMEEKDVQTLNENDIPRNRMSPSNDDCKNMNRNRIDKNNNNNIDDDDMNSLNNKSKYNNTESNPQNINININSDDVTPNDIQKNNRTPSERKKKEKDKDKEKEKEKETIIKCNKIRSTKVVWANKNIENLNFLFTLDSHVPTEPLNIYSGFSPLVTATANVAVSTTKSNYTEIDDAPTTDSILTKKMEIITKNTLFDNNKLLSENEKKLFSEVKMSQNSRKLSSDSSKNNNDVEEYNDNDTLNNMIKRDGSCNTLQCDEKINFDGKNNNSINTKNKNKNENKNENENENNIKNDWGNSECKIDENNINSYDSIKQTSEVAFSSIKLSCDIGENHKDGAFVSHQIVRNNDSDSAEHSGAHSAEHSNDILQIQTKACAGFETQSARLAATSGYFAPSELMTYYNVDSGNFEIRNKEMENINEKGKEKERDSCGREKRSCNHSSTSIIKEKDDNENDVNFMGDFLFDYYTSKSSESDHSKFRRMKIGINQGPALTLMDRCLELAANNSKICSSGKELRNVPQGTLRRGLVDDITIVVLTFN